jgi:hypothetical protein
MNANYKPIRPLLGAAAEDPLSDDQKYWACMKVCIIIFWSLNLLEYGSYSVDCSGNCCPEGTIEYYVCRHHACRK